MAGIEPAIKVNQLIPFQGFRIMTIPYFLNYASAYATSTTYINNSLRFQITFLDVKLHNLFHISKFFKNILKRFFYFKKGYTFVLWK